jgi:hypothetical protein
MYFFSDPGGPRSGDEGTAEADSPFPYALTQKLVVRGLTTASGKKPRISPNPRLAEHVVLVEAE